MSVVNMQRGSIVNTKRGFRPRALRAMMTMRMTRMMARGTLRSPRMTTTLMMTRRRRRRRRARMAIRELVEEKMEGKLKMVTVTTRTQTARSTQAKEAQTP